MGIKMKLGKLSKLAMLQMEINGGKCNKNCITFAKNFSYMSKVLLPHPPLYFTKFFDCAFESVCVCACVCVCLRLGIAIDSKRKLLHSTSDFARPTQLLRLVCILYIHFANAMSISFSTFTTNQIFQTVCSQIVNASFTVG